MGLFNSTCCPPKPKRTMDYILNWIDTNNLIISKNTSFINDLIEWRRTIENDLYTHVKSVADEYITNYTWDNVPQFDTLSRDIATKADKTIPVAADSIALLDINGNIKDSEKKLTDFVSVNELADKADKVENATEGHFASLDANGNLQDSDKKASDFAASTHNHTIGNIIGLQNVISALSARITALEEAQYSWVTIESLTLTSSNKHGNEGDDLKIIDGLSISNYAENDIIRIEKRNSQYKDFSVNSVSTAPPGVMFNEQVWELTGSDFSMDVGDYITLKKKVYSSGSSSSSSSDEGNSSQGSGVTDNPNSGSDIESGQGNTQGPGQQGDAEDGGGLADIVTP